MSSKPPRNWKPSKPSAPLSFANPPQGMEFSKLLRTDVATLNLGCGHQSLRSAIFHDQRCHDADDQVADHLDSHVSRGVVGRKTDRKSTRLNSSHGYISYAVFC